MSEPGDAVETERERPPFMQLPRSILLHGSTGTPATIFTHETEQHVGRILGQSPCLSICLDGWSCRRLSTPCVPPACPPLKVKWREGENADDDCEALMARGLLSHGK